MSQKLIVITGGSQGLGAALVKAFRKHGTVLSISRTQPDKVVEGWETVQADLTTPEGLEKVRTQVGDRAVDVLIHNAGALGPRVAIADYPAEEWAKVMEVNVNAVFRLTQALLPRMRRPGGCILFLASGAGRRAAPHWGAYAVSKFGVDGLALLLAEEVKAEGIRVHSINPGAMRTKMRAAAYPQEDPAKVTPPAEVAQYIVQVVLDEKDDFPVLLDAQPK